MYVKMNVDLLDITDDLWVFQELADHIEDLIGEPYDLSENIESLQGAPRCAKNIVYLWHFFCDISSIGSLQIYLHNKDFLSSENTLMVLKALYEINYTELAEKYESAIKIVLMDSSFSNDLNPNYLIL